MSSSHTDSRSTSSNPHEHRPTVLITQNFHPETIALLDEQYDTHNLWLLSDEEQRRLIEQVGPTCEAVASGSWATNPLIYTLPRLKLISCFGVGVDGINFDITQERGIQVTNTPDVLNDAVADLAMGLIVASSRNLLAADHFVRAGQWQQGPLPFSRNLTGKTLGIAGLGAIGEEVAVRARAFKMKVAYHNRRPKPVPYDYHESLTSLARHSDILLSVLPGGAETKQVLNADVFRALGPDGLFINVGRGSCVDENALVAALQQGIIAGAALDVFANEPHVPEELLGMPNVILVPHIGSSTTETRRAMGQLVLDNLAAYFNERPLLTPVR